MFLSRTGTRQELKSEGKLIEVTPIIHDAVGMPMMLPPVTWEVDNWLLGYNENHSVNMPVQFMGADRFHIPGSFPNQSHSLTYITRILESSPRSVPVPATLDMAAAMAIVEELKRGK